MEVSKNKILDAIVLFAFIQSSLWYHGLSLLIPTSLLGVWNAIQISLTVVLIVLVFARKRTLSYVAAILILFRLSLVMSTYINGRSDDIVLVSRFICLVLALEYFEDKIEFIFSLLMYIVEFMIYFNLILYVTTGPDMYGAYYGAFGYDNGATPYLMLGYMVSCVYFLNSRKTIFTWIRVGALLIVIHYTLFLSSVGTGIMGVVLMDVLVLMYYLTRFKVSLIKIYFGYLMIQIAIVVFRIQNLFSFIIVDMLGKDITFTGRTIDWDIALELIPPKFLFGYGYMDQNVEKLIIGDSYTHNALLEQVFRGGLVYFLMFSLAIYFISKYTTNTQNKAVDVAVLCLSGIWIISISEVVLEGLIPPLMLMLMYQLGRNTVEYNDYY